MLTNIITGYQKTQKVTLSPFRQMYASFDRDCILADEIFIIGYSFGDAHINECLKIALRCNPEVHITIVEPYFMSNSLNLKLALEFFPHSPFQTQFTKINESTYQYLGGKVTICTLGFKEFLEMNQS